MSGFDAAWLALREEADRRARAPHLVALLLQALAGRENREALRIVDLGSGTGATLRAIADRLPLPQRWLCVDDVESLAALCAQEARDDLVVECRLADLAASLERCLDEGADLVTASALLDLVSREWLQRLLDAAGSRGSLLYCALTYDGRLEWSPPHPGDAAVRSAFNAHQGRDKGFGPALGPHAAAAFEALLRERGWRVATDPSDWELSARADAPLLRELLAGIAAAALEQEPSLSATFASWSEIRRAQLADGELSLVVGHRDVLALPEDQ